MEYHSSWRSILPTTDGEFQSWLKETELLKEPVRSDYFEPWKIVQELKELKEFLERDRTYDGVIFGGSLLFFPDLSPSLEEAPRDESYDVDVYFGKKEIPKIGELKVSTFFAYHVLPMFDDVGHFVPDVITSSTVRIKKLFKKTKKYIKVKELVKGELDNLYSNSPLGKIKRKILEKIAKYRVDTTSVAIMKLPIYEKGIYLMRKKDGEDLLRILYSAYKNKILFDFDLFYSAVDDLVGPNGKVKLLYWLKDSDISIKEQVIPKLMEQLLNRPMEPLYAPTPNRR